MSKKAGKKGRVMWGLIYTGTFILTFMASAIFKMTYNPHAKAMAYRWDDTVGKIYTDLSYGQGAANKFDLYVPVDSNKDSYGLVVYLHAGGFTSGDKSEDADMLKRLCSMGYVAAGVNYTLFSGENPEASVYSQSMEIKASIPAIVEETEKLGYHLDRMAVSGGSAGGCLALIYAYRDAETSPLPVKMVFEAVGPASFHHKDWKCYGLDKSPEAAAGLFSTMAGREITPEMIAADDYEDEVRDISADLWINDHSVPTLCAYGKYDKVCPFDASKHLIRALEEHNVPYDYIEFPHSGHGLQNDNAQSLEYMEKMEEYLRTYLE